MAESEDGLASKEELRLIEDLRSAYKGELDTLKESGALPGCFFGDVALTRVLRGNEGDLEKAKEWFERFLARYRADSVAELVAQMEEKLNASGSQFGSIDMLPHSEEVQKYVRFVYSAPRLSEGGDVIWYLPLTDNDRWSLVAEFDWSRWALFFRCIAVLRCLELERLSLKQKRIARCVLIVDLADCSLDTLTCREFDDKNAEGITFAEQIAAGVIRRTIVVNAPQVVDLLSGLARAFMPAKFKDKVSFAKGDGLRDASFVAEAGGEEQLKKLYATRVGLLDRSKHLNRALASDTEEGLPTEEELGLVAQLRERFKDELARREAEGTLHSCFFGDIALTRVLRGNQASLHEAIEWMERCFARMRECDVDSLVAELRPKFEASPTGLGSIEMLPHYEEVKKYINFVYSAPKLTAKGDAIHYQPMGDYDRWGMMEELEWDKWVRFSRGSVVLRCLELERLSLQQNRMVKAIMLVDLCDCTMDSLRHKSFDHANDKDVSKFAEQVAANIYGRFIVVNPSWAISTLYSMVSMFIPRKIYDKLHFQKGDCLQDADFTQSIGGKEQLEQLFAARQGLVAKNGYAQRALTSDQDDRLPTDREKSQIAKLRERFAQEFAEREASGRLHACFLGDIALARVLRGNDASLEEATEWLLRFFTKAKDYNLDGLVAQVSEQMAKSGSEAPNLTLLPHYEEVKEHFRCVFTAPRHTPKGDTIFYFPLSDIRREELMEKVDPVHLVAFFRSVFVLRSMEVERLSRVQGRMVKTYVILDADGSGMGSTGLPLAPKWDPLWGAHIQPFLQEMFAEVIGPCYLLNAPWIMVKGYNWFKALIPEKLSRKFHMLDGDGTWDQDFVELMGGEAQLRYLFSSRVGLVDGLEDSSEGDEVIPAGDCLEKRRDVRPGQEVRWKFQVQAGWDGWFGTSDLDFSVSAFWFPELGEAGKDPAPDLASKDLGEEVRKEETFTADSGEVSGSFLATKAGVVLLRWSNAHSVLRRKSVRYQLSVEEGGTASGGPAAEPQVETDPL